YISPEDVPEDIIKKEQEVYKAQLKDKSKDQAEKAMEGKLESFYESICLLKQSYVLNQDMKVDELINETVVVLKENIKVARFVRFEVGDRS
ncbi:MAG: elongation factor Ts, partial [Patescibacteria group bacterium]|nr:elongation factor Ts [Patescibacteria group bacterium]